ncbi:MAG: hypothetical protein CXT73_06285 [Methanobacteriota archaeon]|nr:MAG: hypothetical protein CXT73_06285 [Euryarchaeota archaeon]
MSRFDRRLKGVGLRPGTGTCDINTRAPQMLGGTSSAYPNNMIQQQATIINNGTTQLSGVQIMTEDQLSLKTRQLEQYRLTAASNELKLITGHEIRLNKLEWINAMCEKMCDEEEYQKSALINTNTTTTLNLNTTPNLNTNSSITEIEFDKKMAVWARKGYQDTLSLTNSLDKKMSVQIDALVKHSCNSVRDIDALKQNNTPNLTTNLKELDRKFTTQFDILVKQINKAVSDVSVLKQNNNMKTELNELDGKFTTQLNSLVKQFGTLVRDLNILKQQHALIEPQMTKFSGLRQEIVSLREETKLLKEDINQLRITTEEKSGEIVKLNIKETEELEKKVSKEVSEEVIKNVVNEAIMEKSKPVTDYFIDKN